MKLLFECSVTAANGVALAHHSVARASLSADLLRLNIVVESWPSEAARLAGAGPADADQVEALVSTLDLSGGLHGALLAACQGSAKYAGGVEVVDGGDTLAGAKSRRLAELMGERQVREFSPIDVEGEVFDGDVLSQTRIVGGSAAAIATRQVWLMDAVQALATATGVTLPTNPSWTLPWTLANNSEIDLSELDMLAMLAGLKNRGAATHSAWRMVMAQIAAAVTVEQALAVTWPA